MEAAAKDKVADGHAHNGRDQDDLPWQHLDYDDRQEGGDEEEDGHYDARHVVVEAGPGVLEDGVAVEDHDVEATEVQDGVHGDGDEEGLEDGGLQEVVDGDLVPQGLLNLSLDLGNFPARRKITTKAIFQQNLWPQALPTTNNFNISKEMAHKVFIAVCILYWHRGV